MADSVQQGTESPELCSPIPDHSYYKVNHVKLPTSINLHCKDRNITISCVVYLRVPLYKGAPSGAGLCSAPGEGTPGVHFRCS